MEYQYFSFLLRLWQAGNMDEPVWRASLENPHTREVVGFNNLSELITYLQQLGEKDSMETKGEM